MSLVMDDNNNTDEFNIEHGIPVPPPQKKKYAVLWKLELGDSLFFPDVTSNQLYAASLPQRNDGRKFTIRTLDGGSRIWRLE